MKDIRLIHNLPRSGGTIISKCLGAQENIVLLSEIQDKKNFINILQYTLKGMGVHVFIGSNTKVFNLAGCSMIIAPLKRTGKSIKPNTLGAIGVIGPSRLNYAKIIPMVDFTAKILNKFY